MGITLLREAIEPHIKEVEESHAAVIKENDVDGPGEMEPDAFDHVNLVMAMFEFVPQDVRDELDKLPGRAFEDDKPRIGQWGTIDLSENTVEAVFAKYFGVPLDLMLGLELISRVAELTPDPVSEIEHVRQYLDLYERLHPQYK
jgi:hypothetical protein